MLQVSSNQLAVAAWEAELRKLLRLCRCSVREGHKQVSNVHDEFGHVETTYY